MGDFAGAVIRLRIADCGIREPVLDGGGGMGVIWGYE